MAKKKSSAKKKKIAKNKPAQKKKAATKKKLVAKKKKAVAKKTPVAKKKSAARKKTPLRKKTPARGRQEITFPVRGGGRYGLETASGGQAGDTQGLSRREDEESESVAALAEEGQYFEAEAVSGVEDAKDPDEEEVHTREVPEDDVPREYTDRESDV
jgi:hypothetical protein